MPGGGNGHLKAGQKSVGVYIGPKDGVLSDLLALVCSKFRMSESELMRYVLKEKLVEWHLMTTEGQPIIETIDRIRSEVDGLKGRLPKSL